jgi:uncharacterized protein YuzE
MKMIYDQETDTLLITLRGESIEESDEISPGIIADLAEDGSILRFEILQASRLVDDPQHVSLEVRTLAGAGRN